MSTIWEIAKEIELEGKKLYEVCVAYAPGEELAGAFKALAREEQRHFEIFESLEKIVAFDSVAAEPVIENVPELFSVIAEEFQEHDDSLAIMRDAEYAYRKALILEKRSLEHYLKIKSQLSNSSQKEILNLIIKEEERHVQIIEGLIEFVHRPKEWLENAEINHLEAY